MSDDEDMVPVASLREKRSTVYVAEYGEDAPDHGEMMHYGSLYTPDRGAYDGTRVEYLEVPETFWSDYSGSDCQRSNHRSIRRDYRAHVIDVYGGYGTSGLVLRLDREIPESLADAIRGIRDDYLIYDENDWSALESEVEWESWENYGRYDFRMEIRELAEAEDDTDTVPELDEDSAVNDLFSDIRAEGYLLNWQMESADGGYWTDFDMAAAETWDHIKALRVAKWDAWARELECIPGQGTLL